MPAPHDLHAATRTSPAHAPKSRANSGRLRLPSNDVARPAPVGADHPEDHPMKAQDAKKAEKKTATKTPKEKKEAKKVKKEEKKRQ